MRFSDACFEMADRVGAPSSERWLVAGQMETERERKKQEERAKINWVCDACRSKEYKGHRFPQNCMHPDGPCPETS